MKVRFSSHKEQDPTREQGMKVLYAPGKRAAFRIRWYLILLLVASPFLWFVGKLVLTLALTEAPARIHLPTVEVRTMLAGQVETLYVQPGSRVRAGAKVADLGNASLDAQEAELAAALAMPSATADNVSYRSSLQRRVDRARSRVREMERLVDERAATQGELLSARDQLDARLAELGQYSLGSQPPVAQQQSLTRDQLQLDQVREQKALLQIAAPAAGRVTEIDVVEGEIVGVGSRLMTLRLKEGAPRVDVYLPPELAGYAGEGQPLTLHFPDGMTLDARLSGAPEEARRLPPDLRTPFSDHQVGLVVTAEPLTPLPERWRLDNVPVTARFPSRWLSWFSDQP